MSQESGGIGNLLILALPLLAFGWLIWSQRKRQKAVVAMQQSIQVGDEVTTTSGLFGVVRTLEEKVATLEIAPDVIVRYDRRAIGSKVVEPEPESASAESASAATPPDVN